MARDLSFTAHHGGVSRRAGGIAALTYPVALIAVAIDTGFRRGGDMADLAASFLGALLFLIAAPTAWVFAIEFIEVGRFTVLVVGTLTSLPLWYLVGARLALAARSWQGWIVRYASGVVVWTSLNLLVVGALSYVIG